MLNYHDIPGLNASGINAFYRSPLHFWKQSTFNENREKKEPTPAMVVGSLCHCLILSWGEYTCENKKFIGTTHMNSTLAVCKKSILTQLGARWCGYHITKDYNMGDIDYDEFVSFNTRKLSHGELPKRNESYNGLSFDIGAWVLYHVKNSNYKILHFQRNPMVHFVSASWTTEKNYLRNRINENKQVFQELEKDLQAHPKLHELYEKYKNL